MPGTPGRLDGVPPGRGNRAIIAGMDIPTLSPGQARERQQHGAILVDIRQPHERAAGQAEGALAIDRAELEADPGRHLPDMDAEVLLVCQLGRRSLDAARVLHAAG